MAKAWLDGARVVLNSQTTQQLRVEDNSRSVRPPAFMAAKQDLTFLDLLQFGEERFWSTGHVTGLAEELPVLI